MKLFAFEDVVSNAVANLDCAGAVFISNHDADHNVFMTFIRELNKKYDAQTCRDLIDDMFDEGLIVFDTVPDAEKFFDIFDSEGIHGTGLIATMYNRYGERLCNNTSGR